MRDEYDLSDAVRHPLAGQFKGKYTVVVHYDLNEDDEPNDDAPIAADLAQRGVSGVPTLAG